MQYPSPVKFGIAAFVALSLGCASTAALQPPVAKKIPHEIMLHGDRLVDDYHWFRDKENPELLSYLDAEEAYTRAVMKPTEGLQETMYREMVSRIDETDARAVVEVERRACVRRALRVGRADVPVAGHAEVRVQRATVVESEELVLATALHGPHSAPNEARHVVVSQRALRRRVPAMHRAHGATYDGLAQRARRDLYLR